ncbi:peptidase [Arthrobacter sp. GCM10027362]|uniref:peptidase n=1 Tax=Arthrobacter sp. GCM10027362 TaxID=3273379 RepID=UPI003626D1B3
MTNHWGTGAAERPKHGGGFGGLPRSLSGRIPQWVFEKAPGRRSPSNGRPARPGPQQVRRPLRSRRGRNYSTGCIIALAACLTLAVGGDLWNRFVPVDLLTPPALRDHPMPGHEEAGRPLGAPRPLTAASGSYKFNYAGVGGRPFVAFSPCRPVHYVVNSRHQPPGGGELIGAAVSRVSQATGLKFVADGETQERASDERAAYQPDRYGDRWAPVLIDWVTPEQEPMFALAEAPGGTTRLGDARALPVSGEGSPDVLVTGQVRLNATALGVRLREPGGTAAVQATIQHELGHIVGLGHTPDKSQLMAETSNGQTDFGAGDLVGLAALGTGPCAPRI